MCSQERDEAEIASQKEQERKRKEELQKKMLAEQERVMDARHEEDEKKAKQHQEQRILQERAENGEFGQSTENPYMFSSSSLFYDNTTQREGRGRKRSYGNESWQNERGSCARKQL